MEKRGPNRAGGGHSVELSEEDEAEEVRALLERLPTVQGWEGSEARPKQVTDGSQVTVVKALVGFKGVLKKSAMAYTGADVGAIVEGALKGDAVAADGLYAIVKEQRRLYAALQKRAEQARLKANTTGKVPDKQDQNADEQQSLQTQLDEEP